MEGKMKEDKEIIVQCNGISKEFFYRDRDGRVSKTKTLDQISFELYKGDALALIGENGSGKTTLLKILSNIIKPTEGRAIIYGTYTSIIDIGNGFHPELTGRENIRLYHSLISPDSEPDDKEVISFAELSDYIDMPVKFYSNGMYLRLAFSIAIHAKTNLLLLDEVLAVGDSLFMNKCYQKIIEKRTEGCAFIIASHSLSDVSRLCNKGVWIKDAVIQYQGDVGATIFAYLNHTYKNMYLCTFYQVTDSDTTEYIDVKSLKVYGDALNKDSIFQFEDLLTVEIQLTNKVERNEIIPVIEIENESGSIIAILGSINKVDMVLDMGEQVLKILIPRKLLNVGVYKLNFRILKKDLKDIVYLKSKLAFRIVQSNEKLNEIQQTNPYGIICGGTQWEVLGV